MLRHRLIRNTLISLWAAIWINYSANFKEKYSPEELCHSVQKKNTTFHLCTSGAADEDLEFIADVKEFAQKEFDLLPSHNHTTFKNYPKTLYQLIATSSTSTLTEPKYQGISTKGNHCDFSHSSLIIQSLIDDLLDEQKCYQEKGYQTGRWIITNIGDGSDIYPGFFQNYSRNLQARVIFHENLHDTDEQKGNNLHHNLLESRAKWVELQGSAEYFSEKKDYSRLESALHDYADFLSFARKVNAAYEEIQMLSANPLLAKTSSKMLTKTSSTSSTETSTDSTTDTSTSSAISDLDKTKTGTITRQDLEKDILARYGLDLNKAELISYYPYTEFFPDLDELYSRINFDRKKMMTIILNTPAAREEARLYFEEKIIFPDLD